MRIRSALLAGTVLATGLFAPSQASPAPAACLPQGGLDPSLPRASVVVGRNEVTQWLTPTIYRVARCDLLGVLQQEQVVVTIPVPGGRAVRVVGSNTTRTATGYVTAAGTFGSATDPVWSAAWRRHGAAIIAATLPPTGSSVAPVEVGLPAGPRAEAIDNTARCAETRYTYNGTKRGGLFYHFLYNVNSFAGGATTESAVLNGVRTWTETLNKCGFANQPRLTVLTGQTTVTANPFSPDSNSVTDFGTLSVWPAPCPGALACAMSWTSGGQITESDVRFDTGYSWWGGNGGAPTGWYDIWRVMAHEFGHTIGFGHTDLPTHPVMHPNSWPVGPGGDTELCCAVPRYLGGGDFAGYKAVYRAFFD
jgi:hypothetical protein